MADFLNIDALVPLDEDLETLATPAPRAPRGKADPLAFEPRDAPAAAQIDVAPDGTAYLRDVAAEYTDFTAADLARLLQARGVDPEVQRRAVSALRDGELAESVEGSVNTAIAAGLVEAILGNAAYSGSTDRLKALSAPEVRRALAAAKRTAPTVAPETIEDLVALQDALGVDGDVGSGDSKAARIASDSATTIRGLTELLLGGTDVANAAINAGALKPIEQIDWSSAQANANRAFSSAGRNGTTAARAAARQARAAKTAAGPRASAAKRQAAAGGGAAKRKLGAGGSAAKRKLGAGGSALLGRVRSFGTAFGYGYDHSYGYGYDPRLYDVVAGACMGLAYRERRGEMRAGDLMANLKDVFGLGERIGELRKRKDEGKATEVDLLELEQAEEIVSPTVELDPIEDMQDELDAYVDGHANRAGQRAKETGDVKGNLLGGFKDMLKGLTGDDGVLSKVMGRLKGAGEGVWSRTKVTGGAVVKWTREATARYWDTIINKWMPVLKETVGKAANSFFNDTLPGLIEQIPQLINTAGTVVDSASGLVNLIASLVGVVGNFLGAELPARALFETAADPAFHAWVGGDAPTYLSDHLGLPDLGTDARAAAAAAVGKALRGHVWQAAGQVDEAAAAYFERYPPTIEGREDADAANPWGTPSVQPVLWLVREVSGDYDAARAAAAWVAHYALPELAYHFKGSAYVDAVASMLRFATQLMHSVGDIKSADGDMPLRGLVVATGRSALSNVEYYAGGSGTPADAPPYEAPGGRSAAQAAAHALLAMMWQSVQDPSMPVYSWVGDVVKEIVGAEYGGEDNRALAGAAFLGGALVEQLYYRAAADRRDVVAGALINLLDGPAHFLGESALKLSRAVGLRVDPGNDWTELARRVDRVKPGPPTSDLPRLQLPPSVLRAADAVAAAGIDAPRGSTVHVFAEPPGGVVIARPGTKFGCSLERRAYHAEGDAVRPVSGGGLRPAGAPGARHEHDGLTYQLYE